jgi:small subunit ribosomal protein S17
MNTKLSGKIIRITPNDTVVLVERTKVHPLYSKRYTVSKKFHASNPGQLGEVEAMVEIVQTKPTSKTKQWLVNKVLDKKKSINL